MHKKHFLGMMLAFGCLTLPSLSVSAKMEIPVINQIQQSVTHLPASLIELAREAFSRHSSQQAPELGEIVEGAILKAGQSGSSVRQIKHLLRKLGYAVRPGEFFDMNLAAQIGSFQQKHQLASPYGPHWCEVGPATLHALKLATTEKNYDPVLGRKLASFAREHISGGSSRCYYYVARTLHAHFGPFLNGMHAYMASAYLATNPAFKEIRVPTRKLVQLPAGAIVVWDKGKSRSGHISIADGKGHEISDHISPQMLSHYGGASARVFLPVAQLN